MCEDILTPEAAAHDQGGDHAREQAHGSDKCQGDEYIGPFDLDRVGADDQIGGVTAQAQPSELLLTQAQDEPDDNTRHGAGQRDEPALQDEDA